MSIELLYAIFIFILLVASFAFFLIKDKENMSKIYKLERAVEEMKKSLHYLQKELNEKTSSSNFDVDALKDEIKFSLDREINVKILPILKSLQGFENVIESFQNEQETRLSSLEQKTQSMNKLNPDFTNEEQKIVELFKQGKSVEQIAKDLRISTGNVEFTLKMKELL